MYQELFQSTAVHNRLFEIRKRKQYRKRIEENTMKKNFIRRKGHLLYATMMIVLMLSGCGQIKPANYVHEAGEDLPMDAAAYAEFKSSAQEEMAMVDLSKVDPNKVGSYEAAIMLEDKKYPFTVEVMDTKAPEGTFQQFVVACGIDQTVTPEWFECSGTDASDFQYGIRSAELVKTEDELAKIIQENIRQAEAEGKEQLTLTELAGVTWNDEADTWDESDVSAVDLQLEFVPEENGLWQLEMLSVDEYGNANAFHVYVIADLEAPEYDMASEVEIKSPSQFDVDDYMKRLQEKLQAMDNLLGDVSDKIEINEVDFVKEYDDYNEVKVSSSIMDLAGNLTNIDHIVKVYNVQQTTSSVYVESTIDNVIVEEGNVHNKELCLEGLRKVPSNILNKFLAGGWHIILTEGTLGDNIGGCTYWSNHTIVIPDGEGSDIPIIIVHEIGHFLGGSTGTPWKSSEFAAIWAEEKDAFAATGGYNGANSYSQMEFFSQVFCDSYTTGYAQHVAPKAYEFVQRYANSL